MAKLGVSKEDQGDQRENITAGAASDFQYANNYDDRDDQIRRGRIHADAVYQSIHFDAHIGKRQRYEHHQNDVNT